MKTFYLCISRFVKINDSICRLTAHFYLIEKIVHAILGVSMNYCIRTDPLVKDWRVKWKFSRQIICLHYYLYSIKTCKEDVVN